MKKKDNIKHTRMLDDRIGDWPRVYRLENGFIEVIIRKLRMGEKPFTKGDLSFLFAGMIFLPFFAYGYFYSVQKNDLVGIAGGIFTFFVMAFFYKKYKKRIGPDRIGQEEFIFFLAPDSFVVGKGMNPGRWNFDRDSRFTIEQTEQAKLIEQRGREYIQKQHGKKYLGYENSYYVVLRNGLEGTGRIPLLTTFEDYGGSEAGSYRAALDLVARHVFENTGSALDQKERVALSEGVKPLD